MKGQVIKAHSTGLTERDRERVAECIKHQGVVAYPAETVYGLGGDAFSEEAVRRIRLLKGRCGDEPFLVLISDRRRLGQLADRISAEAEVLMEEFWPGPLTIVFRAAAGAPGSVCSARGTIGVRISPHPVCRAIVEAVNIPLVSTSANPGGRPPARTAGEVCDYFHKSVDLIIEGESGGSGQPSTVVDVSSKNIRLLREGAVSRSLLETKIGKIHE